MAKARKILKRVRAVKSIREVTSTMEMVATARFRKAHDRVVANRPFVERLALAARSVVAGGQGDSGAHPLMQARPDIKRDAMLVVTSNRGLAGAYNASVLRAAMERYRQLTGEGYQVSLRVVGKRGISAMKFRGLKLDAQYTEFDRTPPYEAVAALADAIVDEFARGEIGGLEVAYMQFLSAGRQEPAVAQVLPMSELSVALPGAAATPKVLEMVPDVNTILESLLPLTVRMKIYQCLLDAAVSEQVMRIAAMRAATENADQMIHDLTVRYNRQRQAQITTELAEIMGGRGEIEE